MRSVFHLSKKHEIFKSIDVLAENLKNLNKKSIKQDLISSENSEYIFLLLNHPDKDVRKKGKYLLKSININRNINTKANWIDKNLEESQLELYYQFIIHFLAVKNVNLYLNSVKLIQADKKKFEHYLIEALVNENEALAAYNKKKPIIILGGI